MLSRRDPECCPEVQAAVKAPAGAKGVFGGGPEAWGFQAPKAFQLIKKPDVGNCIFETSIVIIRQQCQYTLLPLTRYKSLKPSHLNNLKKI